MIVHLAAVAFDVVMFRRALGDLEILAWDHDVGRVGAAAPFLAVDAVTKSRHLRFAYKVVGNGTAEAGALSHFAILECV